MENPHELAIELEETSPTRGEAETQSSSIQSARISENSSNPAVSTSPESIDNLSLSQSSDHQASRTRQNRRINRRQRGYHPRHRNRHRNHRHGRRSNELRYEKTLLHFSAVHILLGIVCVLIQVIDGLVFRFLHLASHLLYT